MGAVAGTIVLLMLLIGIFADFLAPYGMNDLNLPDRLTPPSGKYLLGADHLGRDVLSRIIFGARTSVIIGLSGAAVSVVVAALFGMTGYVGGKLDLFAQRVVDAWMAFPGLLVLITVMSMLGQGALQVIIVLGILGGIGNSRVARSAVMVIKENAVHNGGRRDRLAREPDYPHPRAAQPDGTPDRHIHHQSRVGHRHRGGTGLPRSRSSP